MKEIIRDVLTGLRVVSCIGIPIFLLVWLLPPDVLFGLFFGVIFLVSCGLIGAMWRSPE